MSTIRIEMDGQGRGQCSNFVASDVTIDRSLPGALNSHMSASVWDQFCDKIDEALTPIGEIKRKVKKNVIIIAAVYILSSVAASFISSIVDNSISMYVLYSFIAFFTVVVVVVVCRRTQRLRAQLQEVKEDVKILCRTEGDKMPGVSFHLREEEEHYRVSSSDGTYVHVTHYYIECSVSAIPSMMERGLLATPVAMAVSEVFYKSAAERLAGLEDIKGMLTEKEYNSKRRKILREL